ncbi:MAG: hypothetical protein OEX13_21765, partial [Gammaproteobacteria bacterium]|nr:hypothetical protein [Gammaproteobacteria bacterium]
DFSGARTYLKKAQSGRPRTMRGALTRAEIARATGDVKTALRLYHRIIDEHTYLITEALPRLVDIYREQGTLADLDGSLRSLVRSNPALKRDIAYTAVVNDLGDIPIVDECVEEYISNEPTLAAFVDSQVLADEDAGSRRKALAKVRKGLSKLAGSTPRYQCKECGFSSQRLLWQCPSCKDWETQRPFASVQFDSLLQRSGIAY